MTDLKLEHQRPEGALIEAALKRAPKMSYRQLAQLANLSEGRVRQIINGYQSQAGQILTIVGPAGTVARMAEVAGVTPEEMEAAGRGDAAQSMRASVKLAASDLPALGPDKAELRSQLANWLAAPNEGGDRYPPTETLGLYSIPQLLDQLRASFAEIRDIAEATSDRNWRLRQRLHEMQSGGDGHAEDSDRRAAATKAPASGPANQPDDYGLAAYDEEHAIEDEQGHDETP